MSDLQDRTIRDFGEQWTTYQENSGYYASVELLEDILAPLVDLKELQGCRVAEIGSGTGRIVNMLLDAGVSEVTAIEPSDAFVALQRNVEPRIDRVTLLRTTGDQIPASGDFDYVFSIGVLHHIPEPEATVQAAYRAVRPGGRMVAWLYGKEGTELYLMLVEPLRCVTQRLPHWLLVLVVWLLWLLMRVYTAACRILPLQLRSYLLRVLGQFDSTRQRLAIYDQLNPAYAKYYTQAEAAQLLQRAGFQDVKLHHRHGYSWTVMGTKPTGAVEAVHSASSLGDPELVV